MIRRGKADGWLHLPHDAINSWAAIQGADLQGVQVATIPGEEFKGSALRATNDNLSAERNPLIRVPRDLVLSRATVEGFARAGDPCLRQVLDAAGDFAQTSRGAILIFLLVQTTHNCPDLAQDVGVRNPFTDYIKFLPLELLPTFWSEDERQLLHGTSLHHALIAKLNSLYREYDNLKSATSDIPWCKQIWWDEIDGILTFDDWKQLDAMYRSRALEFPGIGDAMVPLVDMANHASGNDTDALYESSQDGDGLLLLREGRNLGQGDEITITYGDEKGACEMAFSYGFIEQGLPDARDLFLELEIPDDDPLARPKKHVAGTAPGVRIYSRPSGIEWVSDFVYIICVNEEDGLEFKIAQLTDGERELQVLWKDQQLANLSTLKTLLEKEPLWDLYQLRAIATLHSRVAAQLYSLREPLPEPDGESVDIRERPKALIQELRRLEMTLLEHALQHFEAETSRLMQSDVVQKYLQGSAEVEDDFS